MKDVSQLRRQISFEALNEEILSLYRDAGLERGLLGRSALEWTFSGNPEPFCVMRLEGEIVGLSAYIRAPFKFGDRVGYGQQAVDSFVAEKMRGMGLFTTLAEAYAEKTAASGTDLIWGFPNDNAAPVWFKKLGWSNQGQVPLLVKPLRAGYFLRKVHLSGDFPVSLGRDHDLPPVKQFEPWVDGLWARFSQTVACSVIRDRAGLTHRLFRGPRSGAYRIVAEGTAGGALVATTEAEKHGGRIAYLLEAMGGDALKPMLLSELARLRDRGTEIVLAWCFPWSPNYRILRRCGFLPVPDRIRPFRIWFGGRACTSIAEVGENRRSWYVSYLDSDTV